MIEWGILFLFMNKKLHDGDQEFEKFSILYDNALPVQSSREKRKRKEIEVGTSSR